MRNSVLFCGRHKADNPAGIPFFQVLLLSLPVLDNSRNHLPLYRNPDHTLHQINMLRGYAHLSMRIMILFQPVNYRLTQFLKLLCFTHSFFIPFLLFFTCGTISLQDVAASEYYERSSVMEIIDPNSIFTLSKEITLKALETGLISTDKDNMKTTAQNIASFYDEISDCLYNLGEN